MRESNESPLKQPFLHVIPQTRPLNFGEKKRPDGAFKTSGSRDFCKIATTAVEKNWDFADLSIFDADWSADGHTHHRFAGTVIAENRGDCERILEIVKTIVKNWG